MRTSFSSLPFGIFRFLRLYTLSACIVPIAVFIAMGTEELPQIIARNNFLIGAEPIDSYVGLMHTLFTLEDRYGLEICESDGEVHLRVNVFKGKDASHLHEMMCAWRQVAAMLKTGEITQEEYDRWRYRYPEFDTSGHWHKVTPSQGLSDLLVEAFKEDKE